MNIKKGAIIIIALLAFFVLAVFIWAKYQSGIIIKNKQALNEQRIYKVGVVYAGGAYEQALAGLKEGLKNLGYIDGTNIVYIVKDVQGNMDAVQPAIADILKENPDLVYTISTPVTTQAWKAVGNNLPIVFNIVGDPIGAGFAKSYSSSETNLTGCSNISAELSGKRLEIFKDAFPNINKVVTFYNPGNSFSMLSISNSRKASQGVGVELAEMQTKDVAELESALNSIKPGEYDGIYITPDAMVVSKVELIVKKANELGIPTMGHEETLAQKGVAVTYGANFYQLGSQCSSVVDLILKGKRPGNIAIQIPKKLDIVINESTLGLLKTTTTPEILGRTDKIIK